MGVIFLKIKAKNAGIAVATASIFNAEIWKKSPILLSFLFSQSTSLDGWKNFLYDALMVEKKNYWVISTVF